MPEKSSISNVATNTPDARTRRGRVSPAAFWVAWTVALGAKFLLAVHLAPFGDEAWYWQESRHLDWGYSDLPPATAWLIALGEAVCGHGTLGMRVPFVLLGALLPLLLVRLGNRCFGAPVGWQAGLLALAFPLTATLGLFALPDVPLTVASLLALDAFESAARRDRTRDWVLLGLALAAAWLSHYRAAMLFAAGLAFLLVTARGRALWRRPGVWLALGIGLFGLLPTLIFNAAHDWVAFRFQLLERNPWQFHADALVQPLEQALVCTPVFYALLLWAAWRCVRRARAPYDLFACAALVPIVAYFVLGCFADDTRFRVHWPLPGYLPLLLVLPTLWPDAPGRPARVLRATALGLLLLGCAGVFAYFGAAAVPGGALALARVKAFPEHLVGWREAGERSAQLLDARPGVLLVADNFMLAAELEFAFGAQQPVYVLDHPINAKHGRAPQLALWRRDEAALAARGPSPVLLVVEPTSRRERERAAWLQTVCTRIANLTPADALDLYGRRKRLRWFDGESGVASTETATPACVVARSDAE